MDKECQDNLPLMGEEFPRRCRITSTSDFNRVYETRCRVSNELVTVYCRITGDGLSRIGLSVSRKVGNSPVRHYWKRLCREVFRRYRSEIPAGFDYVVVVKKQEKLPDFNAVRKTLCNLLPWAAKKAKKIEPTERKS